MTITIICDEVKRDYGLYKGLEDLKVVLKEVLIVKNWFLNEFCVSSANRSADLVNNVDFVLGSVSFFSSVFVKVFCFSTCLERISCSSLMKNALFGVWSVFYSLLNSNDGGNDHYEHHEVTVYNGCRQKSIPKGDVRAI